MTEPRPRAAARPRPAARTFAPSLALLALLLLPLAAAAQEATPAAGGTAKPPSTATVDAPVALQQELVDKFAPVSYLKVGEKPDEGVCDDTGEQYLPAPVDVMFHDPTVTLRETPGKDVVKTDIAAADLYGKGSDYYVDSLGHPRTPGCDYATRFKQVMGDQPPVVYGHVAKEAGKPGLAVQYWYYYYFNDFNNKHEGDWEMIQLRFDADTVEAALQQEPVEVAYAQHDGGELAAWDDPKLEREGLHPVTYPSRGSHASYFGPATWIGWGEQKSGFGCDDTLAPSTRVQPQVRLITGDVSGPGDPAAWTTFTGRWGAREAWVFDGPTGPNAKPRWSAPMSWMDGLRRDSLAVTGTEVIGPAPTAVFCELAASGSEIFALGTLQPFWLAVGLALALAVAAFVVRLAWPYLRPAAGLYLRHWRVFASIGALVIPLTLLFSAFHYLLEHNEAFAALTGLDEDSEVAKGIVSAGVSLQRLLLTAVVAPLTIIALHRILLGKETGFLDAVNRVRPRFWPTVLAVVLAFAKTFLLAISVVGLPWAVHRSVAWQFVPQEALLDAQRGQDALDASRDAVRGNWWRTAVVMGVLGFVAAAFGPMLGLALLIGLKMPLEVANIASAAVYAVTQPFAAIGATLLWDDLRKRHAAVPAAEPAGPELAPPAAGLAGAAGD